MSISMKTRPVGTELFNVDRQTDMTKPTVAAQLYSDIQDGGMLISFVHNLYLCLIRYLPFGGTPRSVFMKPNGRVCTSCCLFSPPPITHVPGHVS